MLKNYIFGILIYFLPGCTQCFPANNFLTDQRILAIQDKSIEEKEAFYELFCVKAEESNDTDTIFYYGALAVKMAEKNGFHLARPLVLLGNGYLQSGQLALALEHFTKAANLYIKENNPVGLATAYVYIANAYYSQQNLNHFKSYLNKAISIFKKEQDSLRLASSFHNLAYGLYIEDQYDSALTYFSEAQQIYETLGYTEGYAYCLGNMGLVYSKQKNYKLAEEYLLEAIDILNRFGDIYAVTGFMNEYAYILKYKGDFRKAINYAGASYHISESNKLIETKRDAALFLSQLYGQFGKYDSAFHFQSVFIRLSDSIKNTEAIQKMADLRTEFEIDQKQKEVDTLQKTKTNQLIIIIALITIILLTIGLILLYYYSLLRMKKYSVVLEERRKLLEKQSEELKELNRVKDKFFSILSHDLRGPISSIGGISVLIRESISEDKPEMLEELAEYIDQTVVSLSGLLENLLNWAQSQQGQIQYKPQKVDSKEIISEAVRLFSSTAISKKLTLKLNLKEEIYLLADKSSMMVIIRNLLSNAIKFTKPGGQISITTSINRENKVEIEIKDTGIGIPAEKQNTLFDLHDNKSTWGTDREKGFGLGLNLVNEFVTLNKGSISVKSEVGKGTSFKLLFPSGN